MLLGFSVIILPKTTVACGGDTLNFPETIPAWRNFPRTFHFYHASGSGPPKFLPNNPVCLFSNSNNFTYLNEYSHPIVSSLGFSKWSQNQIDGSIKVQRFLLLPPYKPLYTRGDEDNNNIITKLSWFAPASLAVTRCVSLSVCRRHPSHSVRFPVCPPVLVVRYLQTYLSSVCHTYPLVIGYSLGLVMEWQPGLNRDLLKSQLSSESTHSNTTTTPMD